MAGAIKSAGVWRNIVGLMTSFGSVGTFGWMGKFYPEPPFIIEQTRFVGLEVLAHGREDNIAVLTIGNQSPNSCKALASTGTASPQNVYSCLWLCPIRFRSRLLTIAEPRDCPEETHVV